MLIQKIRPILRCQDATVERLESCLESRIHLRFRLRQRYSKFQSSEHVQPHHLLRAFVVQSIHPREHHRLHPERDPQIWLLAAGLTEESAGRYPDDGQHSLAHAQGLAEHVRAATETALPVVVADNRLGRVTGIIRRREGMTEHRYHP